MGEWIAGGPVAAPVGAGCLPTRSGRCDDAGVRNVSRVLAAGLGLALAWPAAALAQDDSAPRILSFRIEGVVDPFVADAVEGTIEDANAEDAAAVLLTIDTPGGLGSSMRQIVQSILNSRVPVVCYVSPEGARAASAGAFILISCPVAAMAPGTNVGAASPVGVSGAVESAKATEDAAAYIRSLAERRERNPDAAEAMVLEAASFSGEQALAEDLVDLIAPTTQALLEEIDGRAVEVVGGEEAVLATAGAVIRERSMNALVGFLHELLNPNIAFIFFWFGLVLLIAELFVPGGVLGTVGALMLILSILALGMLPVQLVGVVLLMGSVVFFALELKHPGLGLPTVGGVIALVLGGFLLFDDAVPSAQVSPLVIVPMAGLAVAFFAVVLRAAMKMRSRAVATRADTIVGTEGTALADLDPVGVVQVASEVWTAESTAGRIEKGAFVRVVKVDGLRLQVEPVRDHATVAREEGGEA